MGALLELMVEHGWRRACLAPAVAASGVRLRDGAAELVAALAAHDIPLVVLSAGLSDVIETLLRAVAARCAAATPPSVAVVANHMVFDDADSGRLVRVMPEPPLHTDNKREMLVALRPDAFAPASPRRIVLLLGDKPKDANSLDLLPPGTVDVVLRVGFMEGHEGLLLARGLRGGEHETWSSARIAPWHQCKRLGRGHRERRVPARSSVLDIYSRLTRVRWRFNTRGHSRRAEVSARPPRPRAKGHPEAAERIAAGAAACSEAQGRGQRRARGRRG